MHMKLRKSDFTGTGKVYRFTLSQMMKGKANIISLIIFFLIAAASIPVMTVMTAGRRPRPLIVLGPWGLLPSMSRMIRDMSWGWKVFLRGMRFLKIQNL